MARSREQEICHQPDELVSAACGVVVRPRNGVLSADGVRDHPRRPLVAALSGRKHIDELCEHEGADAQGEIHSRRPEGVLEQERAVVPIKTDCQVDGGECTRPSQRAGSVREESSVDHWSKPDASRALGYAQRGCEKLTGCCSVGHARDHVLIGRLVAADLLGDVSGCLDDLCLGVDCERRQVNAALGNGAMEEPAGQRRQHEQRETGGACAFTKYGHLARATNGQ